MPASRDAGIFLWTDIGGADDAAFASRLAPTGGSSVCTKSAFTSANCGSEPAREGDPRPNIDYSGGSIRSNALFTANSPNMITWAIPNNE